MFRDAHQFYDALGIDLPGLISVQVQARGRKGFRVFDYKHPIPPKPFLDHEYLDELIVNAEDFLKDLKATSYTLTASAGPCV